MIIEDNIRDEMIESISNLMSHWHPNHDAADYCCEFCGQTADTNQGSITHRKNCDGLKFLSALGMDVSFFKVSDK